MKIGIVIYSNDSETVWNAFRLGIFSLKKGDMVNVFLLGKGVECESIDTANFIVTKQIQEFIQNNGVIFACGNCLHSRNSSGSETCPISTMGDLYDIIKDSDKILTF